MSATAPPKRRLTRLVSSPTITGIAAVLRLLPRVDRRKTWLFAGGIAVAAALPLAIAVVTGLLIGSVPDSVNAGFDSDAGRTTLALLGGTAALVVAQRILDPILTAVATVLGRDVDRHLQETVMAAVGRPPGIAHLEDDEVLAQLRVVRGLGMDNNRPSLAIQALAWVLPNWLRAIGGTVILCWFHWWLGLLWLALWPLVVHLMQREYVRMGQVGYGQSTALREAEYLRDLAITAPAAKEIRIWGMLDWLLVRFDRAWRTAIEPVWLARRPRKRVVFGASGAVAAINLLSFGLLAAAAVNGDISVAAFAVFLQALTNVNNYSAFDDQNAYLSFAAVAVPRILALDAELRDDGRPRPATLPRSAPAARIRFENVAFGYPGSERDAVRGLDLVIPAHRSLAIVGDNGAGKTSIIKLLCGMYEPTAGRITVDGTDLAEVDPAVWRRQTAVLFQDFTRYQLTARENIAMGAPHLAADTDRLRSAAGRLGVDTLIESLPRGWDTVLSGEYTDGTDLSGGQWQRIALARAMFAVEAGATVLVLDEPTAALDVRAEAELYDRILAATRHCTTILISHRFSTVRRADRIVVLSGGAITEDGSHDELMDRGERYAQMFTLQAARFTAARGNGGGLANA